MKKNIGKKVKVIKKCMASYSTDFKGLYTTFELGAGDEQYKFVGVIEDVVELSNINKNTSNIFVKVYQFEDCFKIV